MWLYIGLVIIIIIIICKQLLHMPWINGLHKKCVFITGCDTGFGNALAKSLYAKGVYVFAGCYTEKGADDLRAETGDRLKTVNIDVASTDSIEKAYDLVQKNLPENTVLWGVVNNAGVNGYACPLEFITREDLLQVMNINCFGMVEVARVFLPLIKKSKGRIVNIASMAGIVELPYWHPYIMSKFALRAFSESLRYEKSIWGIKVATICPGAFGTNLLNPGSLTATAKRAWERVDPVIHEEYGDDCKVFFQDGMPKHFDENAEQDLSIVVAAYEHALFAQYPYKIYYPGKEAKVLLFIYKYLPFLCGPMISQMFSKARPKSLKK